MPPEEVAPRAIPFLDLHAGYLELSTEIDSAIHRVLDSGWYVLGHEVEEFEREFAQYVGTKHCIGVGNGLDALRLALTGMGVGSGDEVIVPSNTYIATWLAVVQTGARVVPVEPDPLTCNIDPGRIEAAITRHTKVILPVHLYGLAADMSAINQIAEQHGLSVLEDAAQAHGASHAGRRAGSLGRAAAWSFYPGKNLGCLGDGGAITTDDDELAASLRMIRNYGSSRKYVHELQGTNSRLDELQAAILRAKLPHLDSWNARRSSLAEQYLSRLDRADLQLPYRPANDLHAWHLFVIQTERRQDLMAHLTAEGVGSLIHYPTAPHLQGAFEGYFEPGVTFPISESIHSKVLSLPIGPHLSSREVERIIDVVRSVA